MKLTEIKKILVVSLDNLGDAVMASAVLRPIKRLCPQAHVGLWVKQYASELFMDHSLVDSLHASDPFWDKSPGVAKGGFGKFMKTLGEIRRVRYDVAFLLNTEWRRSFACLLAGIPERVGHRRRKSASFLTASFPEPDGQQHFVDDHRKLIEQWSGQSISSEDCLPRLELTAQDESWWAEWSAQNNLKTKNFSLIHLFSGDEDKNWPLSCWVELVERRIATNPSEKFVLLCGPGEEEKLTPYKSKMLRPETVLLSAPRLAHLKSVIAHAGLVMGGDSGPGHVAAALGTPLLSLFGPTDPRRTRPLGRGVIKLIQKNPLRELHVNEVLGDMASLFTRV